MTDATASASARERLLEAAVDAFAAGDEQDAPADGDAQGEDASGEGQ